jgi:AcrR family transcriptional regulator
MLDHSQEALKPGASTRERIVDAAVELFYSDGFGGAGLRNIAQLASVNVASIYHYFPSKQDILIAIVRQTYEDSLSKGQAVVAEAAGPAEALVALTHHHVVYHASHWRETAISDRELGSLKINARQPLQQVRDAYEQLWDGVLQDGVNAGLFGMEDRDVTRMAILTMCSTVVAWFRPDGRLSVEGVARIYSRLVLRMVARRRS